MSIVPRQLTPLSEDEIEDALRTAHQQVFGDPPSQNRLACAWAQICLENAHGKAIYNEDFGNITAASSWVGNYEVDSVKEQVKPGEWKTLAMHFRAYATKEEGAAAYWTLLRDHYAPVLPLFDAGLPADAAIELHKLAYYTANPEPYAHTMEALYDHFLDTHPTQPPPAPVDASC